jgi:hypothetical protein
MGLINRIIIVIFSISLSPLTSANTDEVASVITKIKNVMNDRQSRISKAMSDVENGKLNKEDFVLKEMPHQRIKFEGVPLKCTRTTFPWLGKLDGYEYEDCIFKVNIKSDADIKGMMIAVAQRTLDGWEVDRNELKSQENIRAEKMMNKERYRFRRKIK